MTQDRVLTIPNLISVFRIVLVPFYVIFLLKGWFIWALVLLIVASLSDYLDGYLARKLQQFSKVGALIDPVADRLLIIVSGICFWFKGIVPLWFFLLVVGREVVLGVTFLVVRGKRHEFPKINFAGKFGSLVLMTSAPAFLLSTLPGLVGTIFYCVAWGLAMWGIYMYWFAAYVYILTAKLLVKQSGQ
jgi:cardiolipin synthase